jgi:hypothetical protein
MLKHSRLPIDSSPSSHSLAPEAAIATGSTDFTNDAWSLQENNLVFLRSQDLSSYYATDFLQLWSRGKITDSTGYRDAGTAQVGNVPVSVTFTPGESATIVKDIVHASEIASEGVIIAAMAMSSGPVLSAISEAIDRGLEVAGPYAPDLPHNFMHDKLIVADNLVLTGSFNFSNHARGNAENTLNHRRPTFGGIIRGLYSSPRKAL